MIKILLAASAAFFVVGCTVDAGDIQAAQEFCAGRNGVNRLHVGTITCQNGEKAEVNTIIRARYRVIREPL